jgi:two-component system, NtrC family, nitrogen regulation sensor histidine kinase NtrY
LLLIFMLTVVASVTVVAYGVTHYTRAAFEEMDSQRTEALVAQFQKEFAQRGEEVVHQVENIANAEITLRMALDLARPNADQSLYVHDGTGAAQDHGLDFVQFVNSDGTLISSAQFPSRVGYKNDWVIANKNWRDSHAFLTKEELPDSVALSLTVVRSLPVGDKNFYIIGGRRLDQNFLGSLVLPAGMRTLLYQNLEPDFAPAELTDAGGAVPQAERYAPLIEQSKKQPQRPVISTISWSADPASAETFHAIPLTGRNNELLGILLVGSSRRELVLLTQRIEWIAASVGAAALLIALLQIWWFSARITHPVEELAVAAREVASGRWDARIDVRTYDEVGQLATAFNDMTRTLAVQKERLLQTERVAAWRELARRLAHELRNPLFPLQITVENLQRARQLDREQFMEVFTESTATLKTELANLNSIVARFSDFSKMPAPRFERMNVNEALHEVLRLFDAQFNELGKPAITRELFLKESLPEIDGDPELLHRAFQNVVLNALDAMPAGGTLTLRTSDLDGKIRVEIADTGNGLTPEESARLFTPYYTTKPQGTGLGLAIVQSVVSDHHGTVSISSEEGRGTTIRIDLPQRQSERTETPHDEGVTAKSEPTAPSTLAAASD